MASDFYVAGDTYQLWLNESGLLVDGAIQNLSGYTVTLIFNGPNGVRQVQTATVSSAPLGLAYYILTAVVGQWTRQWSITNGSITLHAPPIPFTVQPVT
jgi:hypothetical protein